MYLPVLLIILITAATGRGQTDYNYESISIKDGLSNNIVMKVCQDKYGFLWLATQDGLNKYDGYQIETFKNIPGDSTSLPHNWVGTVFEDSRGQIWIGTQVGLARFDRQQKVFKNFIFSESSAQEANQVWDVFEDKKGDMWVGSADGMKRFNRDSGTFERFDVMMTDNTVKKFVNESFSWAITENGTFYAGANSFGLLRFDYDAGIFIQINLQNKFNEEQLELARHWALFADKNNKLWIGTTNGLFVVDTEERTGHEISLFKKGDRLNDGQVNAVTGFYRDRSDKIWISTFRNGMFLYDPYTGEYKNFRPYHPNMVYWRMYEDKYGILWISSDRGLIKYEFDKEPFALYKIVQSSEEPGVKVVSDFAESSYLPGKIWFGTSDGLYTFSTNDNSIQNRNDLIRNREHGEPPTIVSILEAGDNVLWYGTRGSGLVSFNLNTKKFVNYTSRKYDRKSLNSNRIHSLAEDHQGNIWIGTNNGLNIFRKETEQIDQIPTRETRMYDPLITQFMDSLHASTRTVSSILEVGDYVDRSVEFALTRDEQVLVSCMGEGMREWNMVDYGWLESITGDTIWAMNDYYKTFHAGGTTKNRMLTDVLILPKGRYRLRYKSDDSHSVESWNDVPPQDSLMWGIVLYRIEETEFNRYKAVIEKDRTADFVEANFVNNIFIGSDKTVWLATDGALTSIDPETNKIINYLHDPDAPASLSDNRVSDVDADANGNIWAATSNGLSKLDRASGMFSVYREKDGLPTANLRALEFDASGNLWISSINGISRLDLNSERDKPLFVNYDVKDGLQGYEFYTGVALKDSWDNLYFSGNNGVNVFLPGKINTVAPDLVIKDLSVANKSILGSNEKPYINGAIYDLDKIKLAHDKNDLSFSFAALHYSRPDKNKLIYQLEGIDTEWLPGDRKFASYTNLDPGDYVFRLKGSNGDGIWNDNARTLQITILSPWWRTWWAYFLYVAAFWGFLFGVRKFELSRKLKNAKIKESQWRAETAELKATAAEAQARIIHIENERKTKELEEARQLQLSMLPKQLPQLPHLDIAVYMKTATEVGGDYYDFHVSLDGTLTVVVGDATGHGMKAGTIVTASKSLFNTHAANSDILFTFNEMNRCLKKMDLHLMSMCMTIMKIQTNVVTLSSAGMPPALLYRSESRKVEELLVKGMPLGTFHDFPYELKDTTLNPGDTILLMSDGMPELFNKREEMLGYERVMEIFKNTADEQVEKIIENLKNASSEWTDDEDPRDDVTFVVIKKK